MDAIHICAALCGFGLVLVVFLVFAACVVSGRCSRQEERQAMDAGPDDGTQS